MDGAGGPGSPASPEYAELESRTVMAAARPDAASMPRSIGVKTVAAVALSAVLLGLGSARHAFDAMYLAHLSGGACFLIAATATLGAGLVGVGWRFHVRSRLGVAVVHGRLALVEVDRPRELPAMVQRLVVLLGFASVLVGPLGNHAVARLRQLPDELAAPAPSEYCLPEPAREAGAPPPPLPAVEPPGCALIKRAYQLGYTRSLGACAPRPQAAPIAISPITRREVCTRRQLDEPALHYRFRRVAEAFEAAIAFEPVAAAEHRVTEVRSHIAFLDGLLGHVHHAITGSPHAAHHIWITLPDPYPPALRDHFVGEVRCAQRFADLPLWPAWRPGDESRLVHHVLGQLLFATRFGTTASCSDYVIHWGAAPDTCRRLAVDPVAVLDGDGALASVRSVLARRRGKRELRELAHQLGRPPPDAPPAASAIVSLSCLVVDPAGGPGRPGAGGPAATGRTVAIDGDPVGLREVTVSEIRTSDAGPIDVYAALAVLLAGDAGRLAVATPALSPAAAAGAGAAPAGADQAAAGPATGDPGGAGDFLLARLDPLLDADPFLGARAPLRRPELTEVYPFHHHLHHFVDGFRRRYLAQRGRL